MLIYILFYLILMSNKSHLLSEIYKKKEIISNCIGSKFTNNDDEIEYNNFIGPRMKSYQLISGLLTLIYNITNTIYFILDPSSKSISYGLAIIVIFCLITILNILFLVIILKTSLNSKINHILTLSKIFINLIRNLYYIYFLIAIPREDDSNHSRELSLLRNLYLQLILLAPEYLSFKPFKLLGYSIFICYSIIITVVNFFSGQVNFQYNFIPEYFSLLGFFIMVYSSSYFDRIRREIFIHIKQTETFSNYFEALINNMQLQVISFNDCKPVMYNDSYMKYIKDEKLKKLENIVSYTPIKFNNSNNYKGVRNFHLSPVNKSEINNDQCVIETDVIALKENYPNIVQSDCYIYLINFKLADIKEVTNFFQVSKISFSECLKNRSQWTLMNFLEILTNYGHSCTKDNINNSFFYLGIFTNLSASKFFKIYYRIFYLDNNRVIVDFMIDDISQLKKAEVITSESKIKNKLFSKFAHEFKTPLLVIKSLVNDLTENLHIKSREDLETIGNHIMYLSEYIHFLINDIIYYTNNTAIPIQKDIVDLREVIEFTSCVTKALIAVMPGNKKNIIIKSKFDNRINYFIVNSDKTRLKQVLLNFISNSVKFTKQGFIEIEAKLNETEPAIYLIIRDTGLGIKPNELIKLKSQDDAPVQLNIEYSYNEMGTGLGVGIAKNILQKMNHSLDINSTYGEGSEFSIKIEEITPIEEWSFNSNSRQTIKQDLFEHSEIIIEKVIRKHKKTANIFKTKTEKEYPFKDTQNINEHKLLKNTKSQKSEKSKMESIKSIYSNIKTFDKILIADDSETIRKAVIRLLLKNDYFKSNFEFIECSDGCDILSKVIEDQIKGGRIKIIITDENMEFLNGSQAIEILRNLEFQNKITSIFVTSLTAFVDEESKKNIIEKGANIVLNKPLNNIQLELLKSIYISHIESNKIKVN